MPLGSAPAAEAQCKPYYSDYSRFRFLIHQMCTSHYLDLFITGVIGLNVITMAMEHYQQPKVSVLGWWTRLRTLQFELGPCSPC